MATRTRGSERPARAPLRHGDEGAHRHAITEIVKSAIAQCAETGEDPAPRVAEQVERYAARMIVGRDLEVRAAADRHDTVSVPSAVSAAPYAEALRQKLAQRLARLADNGAPLGQLGPPDVVAEQWVAMLPLEPSPMEELTGPFYDTHGLTRWLGVSRQALDSRSRNRRLLVLPTGSGQRVYPAWQWRSDKSTIPHLADVLHPLLDAAADPWTVALWMVAPVDWGDGREIAAWKWLDEDNDPSPVVDEARADAARWAL